MNTPRPDGLSSKEEFDSLTSIEDSLENELTNEGASVYVGRNTSDGYRDFYFYLADTADWDQKVSEVLQSFDSYEFDRGYREDPEWKAYFDFLYPSDRDRKRIENRRVCDAIEKQRDRLGSEREIDHWAYFPSSESRSKFIDGALKLGFHLRAKIEPENTNDRFGAQVFHNDIPAFNTIDDIIIPLFKLARDLGGEYDGWETQVLTE